MSSANLRALLLRTVLAGAPILALAACGTTDGPIFEPDAGEDAGPEPDAGRDAGDQEAPTVVSTTPAAGATGVSPGADVVIEFSEAMADAGTIGLTADGAALTPTRAWSTDGRTLTLSADLPSDARVRLVVERDFADLAGNPLAAPYVAEFTTADAVPPVVTGADPTEGAADVSARTAQIRLAFSEPMDPGVGSLALEGGPGTLGEIAWTLGGLVVPVSGLAYGTSYRVVLSGFADPSGNALDGASYLGDGALDFTTGPDTDPPRVTDASPSEGQIEVRDTTAAVTVTFDEAMDTTVTEATLSAAGESVTVTGTWSAGGTRIDFDVEGLLARNTAHSLDLAGFRDAAGNALDPAPHLGDGALDFVTGVDVFAPYVGFTDPVERASDVSFRRGTITVVFSEAMDTSTTSVEVSDGTSSFSATGTWSLSGTRFEIDVTDRLYATRSYTIDFSAFADAGGTALDAAHPYLGDGVLDFTLGAPTGENCRDALTVAEGTLAGGVHEWVLAPGAVNINDGSNTCPGGNTPGIDAVIRYTKTTAAASAGGTALRIYVESAETITNAWMSVAVLQGECDPTVVGLGPERIRCVDDDNPQYLYLDVGPGDYYVWVSRYTGSDFRGGTVRIEEIAAPPEGESCLAPFTTSTADTIYTAPASAGDPHVWTLPLNAVQAMDHAVAYNGPGAMVCDERIGGGADTNVGNDAVIALPKASGTSIGWLHVESVHTSYELVAQLLDRCDATDPAAASLACEDGLRIVSSTPRTLETTFDGPAGEPLPVARERRELQRLPRERSSPTARSSPPPATAARRPSPSPSVRPRPSRPTDPTACRHRAASGAPRPSPGIASPSPSARSS
ncbi:MAG: Ig-like domain-containing protein [Sandaracinaceae bacterium]|nr:Ig-like domain-containing protein [Sandaracinaceae bacterium]